MKVRDSVMRLLMEEGSISGGRTAEALGVSRTAVWKAVEELRSRGVVIEGCPGGGYRLRDRECVWCAEAVRAFLDADPAPEVIWAGEKVDSTNAEALRRWEAGEKAPFLTLAGEQTRGRGRKGRSFYSPPGGLYMTAALPRTLAVGELTALTAYTALCVCRALEDVAGLCPRIKWINDLYLGDKKIAGILTEAHVDAESGDAERIRVGIGIDTGSGEVPEGLGDRMAFLDIPCLRPRLASRIAREVFLFDPARPLDTAAYEARSMTVGQRIRVTSGGRVHEGKALGIEKNGALILEEGAGSVILLSGDVVRLPEG